MSCPFYGASILFREHGGTGCVYQPLGMRGGNRCGLISSVNYSPCWMEVGEAVAPDWERCPRNPEFVTEVIRDSGAQKRFNANVAFLDELRVARGIAAARRAHEAVDNS
jgi:hypothetical protein